MAKAVNPDEKIAKLEKTVASLERTCDKLEEINKRLEMKVRTQEHQIAEFFAVTENAEAYANHKQFQRLQALCDEYKRLYEHQVEARHHDKETLLARLAVAQEHKHNERGAGRKPVISCETVLKIKREHPEMSLRAMAKVLGVSPSTITRVYKRRQ